MNESIENTSGKGIAAQTPHELSGWNWGAFLLTWIWGIGNNSYIAFLAFVPLVNLFVPFYLGAYGNDLAWKNKYWHDVTDFKRTQRKWTIAGIIITCIVIIVSVINIGTKIIKANDSNKTAAWIVEQVEYDSGAMNFIGGKIDSTQNSGRTSISTGNKTYYTRHIVIIMSGKDFYNVTGEYKEGKIYKITIQKFGMESSDDEYIIYP